MNLYEALASIDGAAGLTSSATSITEAALNNSCAFSRAAFDMFCAMLGTVAGNLALTFRARGGVTIAGGIVPRFPEYLSHSEFRARFEAGGRYHAYLHDIPVNIILRPDATFLGLKALIERGGAMPQATVGELMNRHPEVLTLNLWDVGHVQDHRDYFSSPVFNACGRISSVCRKSPDTRQRSGFTRSCLPILTVSPTISIPVLVKAIRKGPSCQGTWKACRSSAGIPRYDRRASRCPISRVMSRARFCWPSLQSNGTGLSSPQPTSPSRRLFRGAGDSTEKALDAIDRFTAQGDIDAIILTGDLNDEAPYPAFRPSCKADADFAMPIPCATQMIQV